MHIKNPDDTAINRLSYLSLKVDISFIISNNTSVDNVVVLHICNIISISYKHII